MIRWPWIHRSQHGSWSLNLEHRISHECYNYLTTAPILALAPRIFSLRKSGLYHYNIDSSTLWPFDLLNGQLFLNLWIITSPVRQVHHTWCACFPQEAMKMRLILHVSCRHDHLIVNLMRGCLDP